MTAHEALFWEPAPDRRVQCRLCPRECLIAPDRCGTCGVRRNEGGRLQSLSYGRLCAVHVDPIEKKPLFHFMPGSPILSVGTVGCTLNCRFCQNWELARGDPTRAPDAITPPEVVVALAMRQHCPCIAFTYNEPTVFAEYVMDVARLAHHAGLRTVMVTNGYVSPAVIPDLYHEIDAANVDLKALSEDFYHVQTGGHLAPVLSTLEALRANNVWIEVTTLLIPGLNDDMGEVRAAAIWIRDHLGCDTPWHLSAFHPAHRMLDRPPTPLATLEQAQATALGQGLRFVYLGNVGRDSNTLCPHCGRVVIARTGWSVQHEMANRGARCACGCAVPVRL